MTPPLKLLRMMSEGNIVQVIDLIGDEAVKDIIKVDYPASWVETRRAVERIKHALEIRNV